MGKSRDKRRYANVELFWQHFSPDALGDVCVMPEADFSAHYGMETVVIDDPTLRDENFYHYKDNGSDILAVAHLDTCVDPDERFATFVNTAAGWVIHSGALDDRLGAYTILELLPKLGVNVDVLLTVGEESGRSTAEHFVPPEGKDYKWIIEFDRGGTDVVMYQYHDEATEALVRGSGAGVGRGSFSDIAYLEHLGLKAFNWGIGYDGDYHSTRGYAFLEDTARMVAHFMEFHRNNAGVKLPHAKQVLWGRPVSGRGSYSPRIGSPHIGGIYGYGNFEWDDEDDDGNTFAVGSDDDPELARVEAVLDAEDETALHAWLLWQDSHPSPECSTLGPCNLTEITSPVSGD